MGGMISLTAGEVWDGFPPVAAADVSADPWGSPTRCMSGGLDGVSEEDFDYDFDDDFEEEEDDGYGEFDEADFEQRPSDPGECGQGEEEE